MLSASGTSSSLHAHRHPFMPKDKIDSFLSLLTSLNDFSDCLDESFPTSFFQHVSSYLKKYPQFFEPDIVIDAGRFLTLTSAEFKAQRSPKHLMHCLCSLYLLRKQLLREIRLSPEKRHLAFRVFTSQLSFLFGEKRVLSIALALHLPDKYDYFDIQHIGTAVQQLLPNAQIVNGSFYLAQTSQDSIRTLYVEIEKEDGSAFSLEECKKIKFYLGEKVNEKIEKLTHSVFMSRNEEEVMKHILLLSKELKNSRDPPQVMISFEKHTYSDLFFTMILVRLLILAFIA